MYEPLRYPSGEEYPFWAEAFGWGLSACSIVVIPGYMLYYCFNSNDSRGPFTVCFLFLICIFWGSLAISVNSENFFLNNMGFKPGLSSLGFLIISGK